MFSSPEALKNHIIRDHKIGESNHVIGSKKKFETTMKIYNDIEDRKKKKIESEIQKFLKSQHKRPKFIETEEEEQNVMVRVPRSNLDQELTECRRDELKRFHEKAKEEAKIVADLIRDISDDEYEEFTKYGSMKIKNGVHEDNLKRLIRVRNIAKKKYDKESDNLGVGDPKFFKEMKLDADLDILYSMRNMGPPHFLKTKFKLSTIEKCKNVDGLFFGSAAR